MGCDFISIMLLVQRRIQSTTHVSAKINLQRGAKWVKNQLHSTDHNQFSVIGTNIICVISFLQLTEL